MVYLLDSNVIIHASNQYYSIESVPEYWEWLAHMSLIEKIKIPIEIYEEITKGTTRESLVLWVKKYKDSLVLKKKVNINILEDVIINGYFKDLKYTEDDVESLGADPYLIAYAKNEKNYTVVTAEVSKPKRLGRNKKIPDVCNIFNIRWLNPFKFYKELEFKTSWKKAEKKAEKNDVNLY